MALTFDDGPGPLTGQLLDLLAGGDARATFNVLGDRVPGREELVRRALAGGHELGNHARGHVRLAGRPLAAFRQIGWTNAVLRAATGLTPTIFRPPYGEVTPGVVVAARLRGMTTVGWDVNPRDWEGCGAGTIHARVVDAVRPGSIVVLHDERRATEQTVLAVERIVETLSARGYRFATVSELLALDSAPETRGARDEAG